MLRRSSSGAKRKALDQTPSDSRRVPLFRSPPVKRIVEGVGVTGVFFLLFSFQLRPLWSSLTHSIAPDLGDPLFNLLVLKWDIHQLQQGLPDLWHLPIYHPFDSSLLLSDHLLGTALQAWGWTALTGSLIAAYNLLFFASFLLSALSTYAVSRASGLSVPASFLAAAAFAMSPFRWSQASHLQILLMQWIPLTLFFWDRLLAEPRVRWAVAFTTAYVLHLCGGTYLTYMIHFPLLALLLHRGLRKDREGRRRFRRWLSSRSLRLLVPTALVTASAAALVLLPYLGLPFDLERADADFRAFGTTTLSLLTPSHRNLYHDLVAPWLRPLARSYPRGNWTTEKTLFPGFLPTLLGITGLVVFLGRHRRRGDGTGSRPIRSPDRPSRKRRWLLRALLLAVAIPFFAADLYTFAFRLPENPARWLSPGSFYDLAFTVQVVALSAWVGLRRRWLGRIGLTGWRRLPVWPRGVLLVGATTLLLGFPGIFEPLADVLPGLAGMRVPSRFFAFTSFAIAFFAGWGLDALRCRAPRLRHPAVMSAILLLLVIELTPARLDWFPPPEPPAAHHWIAANDRVEAVLELPFRSPLRDLLYASFASLHWKPVANGFSANAPPHYWELRRVCCWPVPEPRALERLRDLGISHVLIHGEALEARWARRRLAAWRREVRAGRVPGVRQVYGDEGGDWIFAIDGGERDPGGKNLDSPRRPQ